MKMFIWVFLAGAFVIGGFYLIHRPDNNQLYIQAIVGEASNQSYHTMDCVAHALRNRGTLKGVYGVWAPHNDTELPIVWHEAIAAWTVSGLEMQDPIHGRKNFGTLKDLEKLKVTAYPVYKCGDLYFY